MLKRTIVFLCLTTCVQCSAVTINVNPGESIQTAIDAAIYGDTVKVASGVYIENITLKNGVVLTANHEDITTIDGNALGTTITSIGCDPNTVLKGFSITNGIGVDGGGMYNDSSSPTVISCIFTNNTSSEGLTGSPGGVGGDGGGMYNNNSSPRVTNCIFSGNSAGKGGIGEEGAVSLPGNGGDGGNGGGMYNYDSSPVLINCIFSGNSAGTGGAGGDGSWLYDPGNGGNGGDGGGIYNENSLPELNNCTFYSNRSGTYGAGFLFGQYGIGGGILNNNSSAAILTNCIMWGDSAAGLISEVVNVSSTANIMYSDIQNSGGSGAGWETTLGTDGGGNIDADPLFADAAMGDFHLNSQFGRINVATPGQIWKNDDVTSECIDAGDPNDEVGNESAGNGSRVNMGAYGGTAQASKSSAAIQGDINGDGIVDLRDFAILAEHWLEGTAP